VFSIEVEGWVFAPVATKPGSLIEGAEWQWPLCEIVRRLRFCAGRGIQPGVAQAAVCSPTFVAAAST
jgi:hypothetical protein